MIKYDYHIHTNNSHDGKSSIEEYIITATNYGLDELCFTEHFDIYDDIESSNMQTINIDKYLNEFNIMKNKYKDKINLKFGIEIGVRPEIKKQVKELVNKYAFDFIIGSSHIVNKKDVGLNPKSFFEDNNVNIGYKKYLKEVYQNILMFDEFDVYGHIDYIVRYSGTEYKFLEYEKYKELLDKILLALIQKGKGIEVNTSGFKYGLNAPHPNYEILRRYKELGGEIITVGSDAHSIDYLCSNFDIVESELKEIGFESITSFENRKQKKLKL